MSKAKRDMLAGFRNFADRIARRYDEAYKAIERGDYEQAHQILSDLAVSHAKTSLSLRNLMIRKGFMEGTK